MIGLYIITNNVTNKSYIGQSGRLESRLSSHKSIAFNKNSKQYNEELYKDIRKYEHIGEQNHNAKYTDEEVINIKKRKKWYD